MVKDPVQSPGQYRQSTKRSYSRKSRHAPPVAAQWRTETRLSSLAVISAPLETKRRLVTPLEQAGSRVTVRGIDIPTIGSREGWFFMGRDNSNLIMRKFGYFCEQKSAKMRTGSKQAQENLLRNAPARRFLACRSTTVVGNSPHRRTSHGRNNAHRVEKAYVPSNRSDRDYF